MSTLNSIKMRGTTRILRQMLPATLLAMCALPASAIVVLPETDHPTGALTPRSACTAIQLQPFAPLQAGQHQETNADGSQTTWNVNQLTGPTVYILPQSSPVTDPDAQPTLDLMMARTLPGDSWTVAAYRPLFGQYGVLQEGYSNLDPDTNQMDTDKPASNLDKMISTGAVQKETVFSVAQTGPVSMDFTLAGSKTMPVLGYIYYNPAQVPNDPTAKMAFFAQLPVYILADFKQAGGQQAFLNMTTIKAPDGTTSHPQNGSFESEQYGKYMLGNYPENSRNVIQGTRLFLVNYDDPENPSYDFAAGTNIILVQTNTVLTTTGNISPSVLNTSSQWLNALYGNVIEPNYNEQRPSIATNNNLYNAQDAQGAYLYHETEPLTYHNGWGTDPTHADWGDEQQFDQTACGKITWNAFKNTSVDPVSGQSVTRLLLGFEDSEDYDMNDVVFGLRNIDGTLPDGTEIPEPQASRLAIRALESSGAAFGQNIDPLKHEILVGQNDLRNIVTLDQPQDADKQFRSFDLNCGMNYFTVYRQPYNRQALAQNGLPTALDANARQEVGRFNVFKDYTPLNGDGTPITETTTILLWEDANHTVPKKKQKVCTDWTGNSANINGVQHEYYVKVDGNYVRPWPDGAPSCLYAGQPIYELVNGEYIPVYETNNDGTYVQDSYTITEEQLNYGSEVPQNSLVHFHWNWEPVSNYTNGNMGFREGLAAMNAQKMDQLKEEGLPPLPLTAAEIQSFFEIDGDNAFQTSSEYTVGYQEWDDKPLNLSFLQAPDVFAEDVTPADGTDVYLYQVTYDGNARTLKTNVDYAPIPRPQLYVERDGRPLTELQALGFDADATHSHVLNLLTETDPVIKRSPDGKSRSVIESYTIKAAGSYNNNNNEDLDADDDQILAVLQITANPTAEHPTVNYSLTTNRDNRFSIVSYQNAGLTKTAVPADLSESAIIPVTTKLPAGAQTWVMLRDNRLYNDADNTGVTDANDTFTGYYAVANVVNVKDETDAQNVTTSTLSATRAHYGAPIEVADDDITLDNECVITGSGVKHIDENTATQEQKETNFRNLRYKIENELTLSDLPKGLDTAKDILIDGWKEVTKPVTPGVVKSLEASLMTPATDADFTDIWQNNAALEWTDDHTALHNDYLIVPLTQETFRDEIFLFPGNVTADVRHRAYIPVKPALLAAMAPSTRALRTANGTSDPEDNYRMARNSVSPDLGHHMLTGIDELGLDLTDAEYYNLQGLRIERPQSGICIVRQGAVSRVVRL